VRSLERTARITVLSSGSILLDPTRGIYNLIISYDAIHYHNIKLNVAIYWIIYAV